MSTLSGFFTLPPHIPLWIFGEDRTYTLAPQPSSSPDFFFFPPELINFLVFSSRGSRIVFSPKHSFGSSKSCRAPLSPERFLHIHSCLPRLLLFYAPPSLPKRPPFAMIVTYSRSPLVPLQPVYRVVSDSIQVPLSREPELFLSRLPFFQIAPLPFVLPFFSVLFLLGSFDTVVDSLKGSSPWECISSLAVPRGSASYDFSDTAQDAIFFFLYTVCLVERLSPVFCPRFGPLLLDRLHEDKIRLLPRPVTLQIQARASTPSRRLPFPSSQPIEKG